ncbi:MAG: hypothetical protein U1F76_23500 [Candidatus Competibacteraceae bacterium]
MTTTTIDNPVINSPFEEPQRHSRFTDTGITNEIVNRRRKSTYFIPIPNPKLQNNQTALDLGVENEVRENKLINDIRERVMRWRQNGFQPASRVTRRLGHWSQFWKTVMPLTTRYAPFSATGSISEIYPRKIRVSV